MLEITLLGEQRVAVGGTPIEALRSSRTLGLLAYLLVHQGAPQLRQHVAGIFWPESTDAQARTNLRRELHQLRGALPDPDRCLIVNGGTVGWRDDAPCRLDLAEFRTAAAETQAAYDRGDVTAFRAAAERAVRAYRGDLLPAFYDDWVLTEREGLRRTCMALLDRLVATLGERGDLQAAVGHARRRVELEPLEESGYRTLMAMQARAGDRAAALRTYHRCTTTLERELGVQPCAETAAVYRGLFAEPSTTDRAVPELPRSAPLVGRDDELAALHAAWARVAQGPAFVVVTGEAGIGKTRVSAEFADALQHTASVAPARCFSSRGRLALGPVAEWLRALARRSALDHLDPEWRTEASRLVPELGAGDGPGQIDPLTDAWQRRRFFEGMARTVLAGGHPTLLLLDDLQWCDGETLAWLELLIHLEPDAPVLVVATLRSEELEDNADLVAFCRRLRAEGILRELELAPLTAGDVAEIAAALLGRSLGRDAAARLQAETGGYPLFVVEAVRRGSSPSARVEAILAGRLAQLSPVADELAGLAAAVGRDFSLELLTAAGDLDDEALMTAIDELWRRRLLREHSNATYDFAHDLLRDAAYARLTPPHRRLLHRRIAAALEQLCAENLEPVAAQIAEQCEQGGQPDRAVRFHTLAAEAAAQVFALDDAVDHYRRALELLVGLPAGVQRDRRELELRKAVVQPISALLGFAAPEAGAQLERAAELSEQFDDEQGVLQSESALCGNLFVQGRVNEAIVLGDRLLARVTRHPRLAGQIHMINAGGLASAGRPAEALRHFDLAEQMGHPDEPHLAGVRVQVMARAWRAHVLWILGRAADAAASASRALELAAELEHPFSMAVAQGYAAITHHLLGQRGQAVELALSVRNLCERYGFAYYGEWGRILQGWTTGGASGEALIRDGLDRLRGHQATTRMPFWLARLAEVLAASGRGGEASRVLHDARAWADEHGDRWWMAELWRLEAGLHEGPEAAAMLERALAIADEQGAVALKLRAATDLARRSVDGGRREEAFRLLHPVRSDAAGCNPEDVTAADHVLARAGR